MQIDKEKFAHRLKELRRKAGLTQGEMAEILRTKRGTVAAWEAGHRIPELTKVYGAAEYFRVSVDYLLGRSDDPTPPTKEESEERKRLRALAEDPMFTDLLMKVPGDLTEEEKESLAESWELILRIVEERRKKKREEEEKKKG